jgi:NitT/TauT family transport system substrate-binding protein
MQFSYEALRDGHFVDGPRGNSTGQFDPARWTAMEQQLADLKLIPKPLDPTIAYTTRFIPQ